MRALLRATGDEYERRGHRLTVLARLPSAAAWSEEWHATEPDNPDAELLHAGALAHRAGERGSRSPEARAALEHVAAALPRDPTPWLFLLLLLRQTGTPEECRAAFEEVLARHVEHHHAHHLMVAALAEKGADVYDFATEAAERAPGDSPLAFLPLVAHAERFRAQVAAREVERDPSAGYWRGRQARRITERAFAWWLEWGAERGHPRRLVDLNFLAHATYHEGRFAEAAALFQRIGEHGTAQPWEYSGTDPSRAFRAARKATLGPT